MTLSSDPTLRNLNNCGCCEGVTVQTLLVVMNRLGLTAVAYRVGEHPTFKASMLASLSATDNARLQALATREDDDFSIALLDAWATALDVLTFYQERIANESYLRTATERVSLLQLARLIGYELRPGVAASTALAFTLEDAPGAPKQVTIDVGVKVQSSPGPGEQPQMFETVEKIEARPEWNAIKPRLTRPQTLSASMSPLWLQGTDANIKTGDALLVVAAKSGGGFEQALRRIASVAKDDQNNRTRLALEAVSYGPIATTSTETGVWAMRVKAAPFGHNAPLEPVRNTSTGVITDSREWNLDEPDAKTLTLDVVYDQIQQNSWVVIDRPNTIFFWVDTFALATTEPVFALMAAGSGGNIGTGSTVVKQPIEKLIGLSKDSRYQVFAKVNQVRTLSRADYGITARATQLTLDTAWLNNFDFVFSVVRESVVYAQSEKLTLTEEPITTDVQARTIELNGDYSALQAGRAVVVSGQLTGAPKDSPSASEIATLDKVERAGGITTLTLATNLANKYKRETVTINANVAPATHGETVSEVLGSGNGSQPYQKFTLRQSPLTYVSSSDPSGADSTLQVRVNDVRWHEVLTLFERSPNEHIYVTRADDPSAGSGQVGKTSVQFGDGANGARLPSGSENVRATYRKCIGAAGNVKAGQLSLLMTRPLGVKDVINPEAATGGADGEARDEARRNAPLTALTLGRIVSLRDYEDFARAFAGITKALATWTWDGQSRGVFVTVAGVNGAEVKETSDTFKNLVKAMQSAGDPYVSVRVKSYAPKLFRLSAVVTKDPDYLAERVQADVKQALLAQFSFDARAFGQPMALSEVMAVIQSVAGVVAVDVNELRRNDFVGGDGLKAPLPAAVPQAGTDKEVKPAELLTIDPNGIDVTVQ